MEHSEEIAFDTADHKLTKWLRYINTFMIWLMYQYDYSNFFIISAALHLPSNSQMEVEANDTLPFVDVLAMKRGLGPP
jgi:hypothetical protein